jgi:hypothetical protein
VTTFLNNCSSIGLSTTMIKLWTCFAHNVCNILPLRNQFVVLSNTWFAIMLICLLRRLPHSSLKSWRLCIYPYWPCSHVYQVYDDKFLNANGDVQKKWNIMMHDIFIYHAHTLFSFSNMCVGLHCYLSTLIEHELTKRPLESIKQVSSRSNLAHLPLSCLSLNIPNNFSFSWFFCNHVDYFCAICDNHVPMILNIDALCVANLQQAWGTIYLSKHFFKNNATLDMHCYKCY